MCIRGRASIASGSGARPTARASVSASRSRAPRDFRLWVCLHEETHRAQFMANPWLTEHLQTHIRSLATDLMSDPGQLAERVTAIAKGLPDLFSRNGPDPESGGSSILDVLHTPDQRSRLSELTAVMSLLEGHADVVMDEVGPQVVPSVREIRQRFEKRRDGLGIFDVMIRRLLGMEAKMAQYRTGALFVRGVQDRVGVEGFNAVWAQPENLPSPEEIAEPALWVNRVHGPAALPR